MIRTLLTLAAGIGVGVAGTTAAQHDHHEGVKVTTLAARDIVEKLDGKETKATFLEVTLEARPGGRAAPPRRPGVRLRPGGRVRVGHRRPAREGAQGR